MGQLDESTATNLGRYLGRKALYSIPEKGLTFRVWITDTKIHYGHVAYQITPDAGEGSAWVVTNLELTDWE